MKIALCEDEKMYIEDVKEKLKAYVTPEGGKIVLEVFGSALILLDALGKEKFDAILLDIVMPGYSGMEAARDIRRINASIPIVFLTSSPEYAVESYRVHAFDYLMKPVKSEDLFNTLNDIFAVKQVKSNDSITVTYNKETNVILLDKLVFLEVRSRTLYFYMLNGSCIEVTGRLSDYEEPLLTHSNFLKVHRSFIVNMNHMKIYDRKSFVSLTGQTIPISRTITKEVQNSYMDYLHTAVRVN